MAYFLPLLPSVVNLIKEICRCSCCLSRSLSITTAHYHENAIVTMLHLMIFLEFMIKLIDRFEHPGKHNKIMVFWRKNKEPVLKEYP